MKTSDLKKGTRIQMRNGWFGTLMDNKKGTVRNIRVEGVVTETGDCYSHDIVKALVPDQKTGTEGTEWVGMEYTPAQIECKRMADGFFSLIPGV